MSAEQQDTITAAQDSACLTKRLVAERLPDLNTPRAGHQTLVVGNELMVAGGHTDGFVPTATAEFLRPGESQWRQQPMVYTHDFGTSVLLRSGEVLLMGGAAEPLGIGQTFTLERYTPKTRTFEGFGCLDTKRMYASAEQLSDGDVLVSGNWFHADGMELFDGQKFFSAARETEMPRACPFIFPTASGDAFILGDIGTRGEPLTGNLPVERLQGEPFDVPLLRQWHPIRLLYPHPAMASCIGDTAQGDYTYLLVLENHDLEQRIALVETSGGDNPSETAFSLLPDVPPLPQTGPEGQCISYISTVIVDRTARRGYVLGQDTLLGTPANAPNNGRDSLARHYVFSFSYQPPFSATLYYTDPLPGVGFTTPVLMPNGDMVLVAGAATDNFAPLRAAYRLPLGRPMAKAEAPRPSPHWLWWLVAIAALLATGFAIIRAAKHRRRQEETKADQAPTTAASSLMPRIMELMEQEQLYLNSNLTVGDAASRLGVHRNAVSQCITASTGSSFPQLVTRYRVKHAQQILRQQPDMKLSAVAEASGFATESSFFRAFKAIVGMPPREWVAQNGAD